MSRLTWDAVGLRRYEAGVDRGVLYVKGMRGVPWNGLVAVNEAPTGGEVESYYFDGRLYYNDVGAVDFQATIEAYTYPDEFSYCEGYTAVALGLMATGQPPRAFDMVYRTLIGNDVDGLKAGYKLHMIYNAVVKPTSRSNKTRDASPSIDALSWTVNAASPVGGYYRATSHFIVDSTVVEPADLELLENILYGTDGMEPYFPAQDVVVALLGGFAFTPNEIIDGGDELSSTTSGRELLDGGNNVSSGDDVVDGGTQSDPSTGGGTYIPPGGIPPTSGNGGSGSGGTAPPPSGTPTVIDGGNSASSGTGSIN